MKKMTLFFLAGMMICLLSSCVSRTPLGDGNITVIENAKGLKGVELLGKKVSPCVFTDVRMLSCSPGETSFVTVHDGVEDLYILYTYWGRCDLKYMLTATKVIENRMYDQTFYYGVEADGTQTVYRLIYETLTRIGNFDDVIAKGVDFIFKKDGLFGWGEENEIICPAKYKDFLYISEPAKRYGDDIYYAAQRSDGTYVRLKFGDPDTSKGEQYSVKETTVIPASKIAQLRRDNDLENYDEKVRWHFVFIDR